MISVHRKKTTISSTICLVLGITFLFSTAFASKPYIEKSNPEYYLKGTLEETADFNFNINAGEQLVSQITIVNNSPIAIDYRLDSVDSAINNQQIIVFNSQSAENPNLGTWINFENRQITIDPESSLTIPFTIQIPKNAFPGSYYGGISILKVPTSSSDDTSNAGGSSMTVKTLTRQVLGLTVNIAGTLDKSYNISSLEYDKSKKNYFFTIENTGNVLLSFDGDLGIINNNLLDTTEENLLISNFKILPGSHVTKTISYPNLPLFGNIKASINGQLQYFNGLKNSYEDLDTIALSNETISFSWSIIGVALGIILLLLTLIVFLTIREKRYLLNCVEYTVKPEETIEEIAKSHQMSWKKLASINNKLKPPFTLKPDQKILVYENNKTK